MTLPAGTRFGSYEIIAATASLPSCPDSPSERRRALFSIPFGLPPIVSALVLLATLPVLLIVVLDRSEKAAREWPAGQSDGELAMFQQIPAGEVGNTGTGACLESLKTGFTGEAVADMLCLLQIRLELTIRATGIRMAWEGLDVPARADVRANLNELLCRGAQIGRSGLLA